MDESHCTINTSFPIVRKMPANAYVKTLVSSSSNNRLSIKGTITRVREVFPLGSP